MQRGYCGIGIYGNKYQVNLGTLWRSAHAFGAVCLFAIGPRCPQGEQRQASDTTNARRHIPYSIYPDMETFLATRPYSAQIVAIEQTPGSYALETYLHPQCALYLLGAEDTGLPLAVLARCDTIVSITTPVCLNVATAGSIVLYDRVLKQRK